ncbi:cellulose synthase [Martelella mediterranea]|uniref:Tetratricopeptide repeat protein n=1 Tax=Martelella mediterranea TaxID=293089 RepID=A0A4R3NHA5_9HYPH|nr:cellulose synthase [Martelella mediterranea]TCT31086.1 hypothetical protein EDC90_10431 [Martelella mediterranea]
MKLAYFALTAAAIAMIGAVGIHGTGRNKDQPLSLQQDTGDFQTAYDRIVERDPAEQMRPVSSDGFSSVPEAQAQQTSPNLRNLSEVSPTQSGNDNNAAPAEADRAPNQPDEPSLKVDESALRYFAQQGDLERLQAEISRLRSLYPNWTPPANPLAVEDGEDDQMNAMWQAYAQGDYAKVNEMIRQRQQEEPDWTPPADLLDRLNLAETRQKLLKAADAGNYQQVIDLASQAPGLLTCSEINILWQVGEAFAKTEKLSRAVDAYSYILKNCDKPEERFATMQKAMQLLPFSDVKTLLTYERTDDAGGPEFQEIRDELLRKRFAEAGADESITVAPEDLDHMETLANTSGDPDDAELLAWYFLQRGSDAAAEEWFRKANAEGGSATTAQGLALILIGQDRASEAENIMYPWRNDSDQAMDTYLNAVVNMLGRIPREEYSDEVLKRMSEVVSETKSTTAAQQFGWYSNDMGQPLAGLQWFEASLSWEPWDEPAAYGVTMMLNRLNYRPGVYQMQKIWAPYSERIAWLYDPNAPVATLDDLKATVFQLTTVKQNNGTSRTVAVPISEIDLATGVETPLGGAMQSTGAPAPSDGAGNMPGVSLTAPLYAPGSNPPPEAAGEEGEPQTVNYVPEYYRYYYGQTGSDDCGTTIKMRFRDNLGETLRRSCVGGRA